MSKTEEKAAQACFREDEKGGAISERSEEAEPGQEPPDIFLCGRLRALRRVSKLSFDSLRSLRIAKNSLPRLGDKSLSLSLGILYTASAVLVPQRSTKNNRRMLSHPARFLCGR